MSYLLKIGDFLQERFLKIGAGGRVPKLMFADWPLNGCHQRWKKLEQGTRTALDLQNAQRSRDF